MTMRAINIFAVLIICITACAATEKPWQAERKDTDLKLVEKKNSKGQTESYWTKGDMKHGKYVLLSTNGNTLVEGWYADGKLFGPLKEWQETGVEAGIAEYLDGQLHGMRVLNGAEGAKWRQENWFQGELHGAVKEWASNGHLLQSGQYTHGKKSGKWVIHFTTGFKKEGSYEMGEPYGIWTSWHPNGVKASEAPYKQGKLDGEVIEWDDTGKEISRTKYVNGEKQE